MTEPNGKYLILLKHLERANGFEPSTLTLATHHSNFRYSFFS